MSDQKSEALMAEVLIENKELLAVQHHLGGVFVGDRTEEIAKYSSFGDYRRTAIKCRVRKNHGWVFHFGYRPAAWCERRGCGAYVELGGPILEGEL